MYFNKLSFPKLITQKFFNSYIFRVINSKKFCTINFLEFLTWIFLIMYFNKLSFPKLITRKFFNSYIFRVINSKKFCTINFLEFLTWIFLEDSKVLSKILKFENFTFGC